MQYCELMYFKTLETCLEVHKLDPTRFLTVPGLAW